jgi:hypothetical protein
MQLLCICFFVYDGNSYRSSLLMMQWFWFLKSMFVTILMSKPKKCGSYPISFQSNWQIAEGKH